jgi:hypothetical protein
LVRGASEAVAIDIGPTVYLYEVLFYRNEKIVEQSYLFDILRRYLMLCTATKESTSEIFGEATRVKRDFVNPSFLYMRTKVEALGEIEVSRMKMEGNNSGHIHIMNHEGIGILVWEMSFFHI